MKNGKVIQMLNGKPMVAVQSRPISKLEIQLQDIHSAEYMEKVLLGLVNWINTKSDEARQQGAELIQLRYIHLPEDQDNRPSIEMIAFRGLPQDKPLSQALPCPNP